MANELKVSFYLKRGGKSETAVANPNEVYPIVGKIIIELKIGKILILYSEKSSIFDLRLEEKRAFFTAVRYIRGCLPGASRTVSGKPERAAVS